MLVIVKVLDANDHSPTFDRTNYTIEVSENEPIGMKLSKSL